MSLLYIKQVKGKYIVIESDDWGSIRQSSVEAWKEQLDRNPQMEEDPFFFFDSFECCRDLERLFDILIKYKDEYGNHPVITADYAMANPDFVKIKKSQLQCYFYEPITETVKSYSGCDHYFPLCSIRYRFYHICMCTNVLDLWFPTELCPEQDLLF